jgi:hypothetical protein
MNDREKLSQLGRNQLVLDCENFVRKLFFWKRAAAAARAKEKRRHKLIEKELEIRIDDISSIMGLPPTHPLVLAAVAHTIKLGRARWEREQEDAVPQSYIGWGDNDF